MKMKTLAVMALAGTMAAAPAVADLVIPDLSYRTGPYAAGGTPFSDGYQDYFNLLNARDGGIGGEHHIVQRGPGHPKVVVGSGQGHGHQETACRVQDNILGGPVHNRGRTAVPIKNTCHVVGMIHRVCGRTYAGE